MSTQIEILRTELIGMQGFIAEFQKWKLIGIGALFSVGLGLSGAEATENNSVLALLAIPIVTTYADLLIRDYDLRLSLIACFSGSQTGILGDYEKFLATRATRGFHWALGNVATIASTLCANIALLVFAGLDDVSNLEPDIKNILSSGAGVGIVACALIHGFFHRVVKILYANSNRVKHPTPQPEKHPS